MFVSPFDYEFKTTKIQTKGSFFLRFYNLHPIHNLPPAFIRLWYRYLLYAITNIIHTGSFLSLIRPRQEIVSRLVCTHHHVVRPHYLLAVQSTRVCEEIKKNKRSWEIRFYDWISPIKSIQNFSGGMCPY
jgi:hypothetical protein